MYDVRDSVKWFAETHMERKLIENDHKGGWQFCSVEYLKSRLLEEVQELMQSIKDNQHPFDVSSECADVANISMMIAEVYKQKP